MRLSLLTAVVLATEAVTHIGDSYGTPSKFDYRQTFKYPLITSKPILPYFNKSGDVLITQDFVRVVPSLAYQSGSLWCETKNEHKEWMVEFSFSVYGRTAAGGEGFVFWYTADQSPPKVSPDFYGHSSIFKGLAIVFDTSDTSMNRFNPFIYGLENNGLKSKKEFENYASPEVHLGSCFREYRNTPTPVWVKVIYQKNTLRMDIDIRQGGQGYTTCFEAKLDVPSGYHFGISATTTVEGQDDHDFHSFEVYELNPLPKGTQPERPFEKQDIADGKEFKMTETLFDKIKETENKVMEVFAKDQVKQGAVTMESVTKLVENQFHILEALETIQDKLQIKPIDPQIVTKEHQQGFESRLGDQLTILRYFSLTEMKLLI
jgi:hypothetical protein